MTLFNIFRFQSERNLYPGASNLLEDFAIKALCHGHRRDEIINFMELNFDKPREVCENSFYQGIWKRKHGFENHGN